MMATGSYDANGFYTYGEDDLADPGQGFSELLNKSSEAVRVAVPVLVHNRVIDELNDDATIRQAASAAFDEEVAGRELVETSDSRLPQNIGEVPGWSEVITTPDGWVISGLRDTGPYSFFGTNADARTLDPLDLDGYVSVTLDKTGTWVLEADLSDGTKYFPGLKTDRLDAPAVSREAAIGAFGDSMTGDHMNTGTAFGAQVGIEAGVPSFQGGVPGQTSTEAAFRAGGTEMWARITGGTLTPSTTVEVVVALPTGTWKTGSAWTFSVTCETVLGARVAGVLSKSTDNTWTFTPSGLQSAVDAPREVRFTSTEGAAYGQRGIIFRAGRNNPDLDTVLRDYRSVREWVYANQARPRFLGLPLYTPAGSGSGTSLYAQYAAINAALAKECASDWYDLQRWMIRYGLAAAGITPTAQDTADIAADYMPSSLRFNNGADITHLSVTGRQVEAKQVAFVLKTRKWFS